FGDIVGRSLKMREIFGILEKIATTSATIIIEGETGTGKEVVARTIHKTSSRKDGPFVVFDCGAVPESLIESELFGHEKGSFTGAVMTRKGLFEMAEGGTIFLDELGELALDLQPKLLRVLEQREVRRVGSNKSIPINVRVVAATNRDLETEVRQGNFREDLFYRLSVVRLMLPALRERKEDIPLLAQHFLTTQRFNKIPSAEGQPSLKISSIDPEAISALENYEWPGNVRELVNVVERACSMAESHIIRPIDLPPHISGVDSLLAPLAPPMHELPPPSTEKPKRWTELPRRADLQEKPFKEAKEEWVSTFERDYITELLMRHGGNISQASREADIDRKYFKKLMLKYDIEADDF
ncbi:MAG: sigma-54 dependent transcriptional regulator, partial [Myxococcota bacterium]|nr:sigma-54 dependent transcriptional regulator [Myxococcota bacterium]